MPGNLVQLAFTINLVIVDIALMTTHFFYLRSGKNSPFRKWYPLLKCSLPPLLCIYSFIISVKPNPMITVYFSLATLGDLFMLSRNFTVYVIGGLAFLASHITMALIFNVNPLHARPWTYLFMIPGILFHLTYLIPKLLVFDLQHMSFILYALVLEYTTCCSAAGLVYKTRSRVFCYIGYLFFLTSDTLLLRKCITQDPKNRDLSIMSTYFIAQVLLANGASLL